VSVDPAGGVIAGVNSNQTTAHHDSTDGGDPPLSAATIRHRTAQRIGRRSPAGDRL